MALLFFLPARTPAQSGGTPGQIEHSPIISFIYGDKIALEARVLTPAEWLRIYYRYEGLQDFQVRDLEKKEDGTYFYELDSSGFPGLQFEYYLEAKTQEGAEHSPPDAPRKTYQVTGTSKEALPQMPAEVPSPQAETRKFRLPVSLNGSLQAKLKEHKVASGSQESSSAGNLRVFTNYTRDDLSAGLDSNFSYSSVPLHGENSFNLANMMVSVSKGNHSLKIGDFIVNETEFTVLGLGRRGLDYAFDNHRASLHVFDVGSQQLRGFRGFGFPKSGSNILGGALGYKFLKEMITLKVTYLTGKDDPNQGTNVGFSSFVHPRKGNVVSLAEVTNLFQNQVTLTTEVARSEFDGDVQDRKGPTSDYAWKIGGNVAYRVVTAAAVYRQIGRDFNSIGFPFFANDREGLESNFGLNLGRFSIMSSYIVSSDNVRDDPAKETTSNQNGNVNLMLNVSNKISLGLGYSRNKQGTSLRQGVSPFLRDSLTDQISGSFNLNLGQSANLSLQLSNSDLSSQNFPQASNSNFTFNLGGAFRGGERLTLAPTLGYGRVRNKFTHEEMLNYNSFVTGEVVVWPQAFTVSFTGSFMRTESSVQGNSDNLNSGANLNLYLNKLIKIGTLVFSLKGNYTKAKMPGFSDSFFTAIFQADFSF